MTSTSRRRFTFPKTPDSKLVLATDDHVPELHVTPDSSQPVAEVHVYYSVDPDPRARFWRSAEAKKDEGTWTAKLPILSVDQPLFAFANVVYRLKKEESEPFARPDRDVRHQFHAAHGCPEGPATGGSEGDGQADRR